MVEERPDPTSQDEATSDPLSILAVIPRLEVGPVKVEPRRLITPYRVVQHGEISTIDHVYRFEEDVFNRADLPVLHHTVGCNDTTGLHPHRAYLESWNHCQDA